MRLKDTFDAWAKRATDQYAREQWLLSKWEPYEGIKWSGEKIDILVKSIMSGLNLKPSDTLIELGCGGGWLIKHFQDRCRRTFALDFSIEMLEIAHRVLKETRLVCAEVGQIPFSPETFDCILCYFVFINIDEDSYIEQAILEILRVLKNGGRALIGQLPDQAGSYRYEEAKKDYFQYCQKNFDLGKETREEYKPPLRLFDRETFVDLLKGQPVRMQFRDSFNPFYYPGQPERVDWRFDLVIQK